MSKINEWVRRSSLKLAIVGVAFGGLAAPAMAQQDIEEHCRISAHAICSFDTTTWQHVWPTFECVDREYRHCMDLYGPKED